MNKSKPSTIDQIVCYMLICGLVLGAILFMSSCKPSEQLQRKRANEFFNTHPAEIAKRCADQFPHTVKEGKTITRTDTIVQPGVSIPCPPNEKGDTVFIKCPPSRTIRDTVIRVDTIENIARIYALQHESDSLRVETIKDQETITTAKEELKNEQKKNRKLLGIFVAMAIISGAFLLLKITKRI